MNELQKIFNYKGSQVRTVIKDGEPWFVAKDVCDVLGLTNPSESLRALDTDEKSTLRISEGGPEANIINEPGLYSLVIRSNKPEAKDFKRWITHEVLPSIRKTGTYIAPTVDSKMLYRIAQALEEKERQIALLTPKAQSYEILMDASGTLTMNEVAKLLDIKGVGKNNLFKLLTLERIIYRQGNSYYPYQAYRPHFVVKQNPVKMGSEIVERSQLFMTTKGIDWLAHKLIDLGYQLNYYKGKQGA